METLWGNLQQHWTANNIALNQPATLEAITKFESERQIFIPSDFKAYLLHVNGMKDQSQSDDDWLCFWSLQDLKSLAEDDWYQDCPVCDNADEYFIFADHCIRVFDFAVRFSRSPTQSTPVYFVSWPPCQIAASFEEWIERYLAGDPDAVCPNF